MSVDSNPAVRLVTDRPILRRPTEDDAGDLFELDSDPEARGEAGR